MVEGMSFMPTRTSARWHMLLLVFVKSQKTIGDTNITVSMLHIGSFLYLNNASSAAISLYAVRVHLSEPQHQLRVTSNHCNPSPQWLNLGMLLFFSFPRQVTSWYIAARLANVSQHWYLLQPIRRQLHRANEDLINVAFEKGPLHTLFSVLFFLDAVVAFCHRKDFHWPINLLSGLLIPSKLGIKSAIV